MLLSRSGETAACKSALSSTSSAPVTMFEEKGKLPFEQHCSCSNSKIFWLNYFISVIFVSREMLDSEAHMDVSSSEQYGPTRKDVGPSAARPRGFHASEFYLPGEPYPTSNVTRDHTFVLPAEYYSSLEVRISALETRVNAMQKKMDEWDEWYNEWTPLFKLLYRIFSSFIRTPRYWSTDSAGSDVAV